MNIPTPIRDGVNTVRQVIALVIFIVAFTIFTLPFLAALLLFAVAAVICLAIITIGCVVGGVIAIPAIVITPDGVKTVVDAARDVRN